MTPSHTYSVYGLAVDAMHAVPGLARRDDRRAADLTVRGLANAPAWSVAAAELPWIEHEGIHAWRDAAYGLVRIRYADGIEFRVELETGCIEVAWPDPQTFADAATYLVGPILGFVLRMRGVTCLHAATVAAPQGAIGLMAPGTGGKSTLAAGMLAQHFAFVTDDVAALDLDGGGAVVRPGYPCLRLWGDALEHLTGSASAGMAIAPHWAKRFLPIAEPWHGAAPRLRVLYTRDESRDGANAWAVRRMEPAEAVRTLLSCSYPAVHYTLPPPVHARTFADLTHLAETIPVVALHYPPGLEHLDDVAAFVAQDAHRRMAEASS